MEVFDMNRSQWLAEWAQGGKYYEANRGYNGNGEWVRQREIRVFRDHRVSGPAAANVLSGVYETVKEVGVALRVQDYAAHNAIPQLIEESKFRDKINAPLFAEKLHKKLNDGRSYGNIVIIPEQIQSGHFDWSEFARGFSIISVPEPLQTANGVVGKYAKHATLHMLGYNQHHGDVPLVGEYQTIDPKSCVMHHGLPKTTQLCERDLDATRAFWKALERDFNQRLTRF
jgi:hypothetical protein